MKKIFSVLLPVLLMTFMCSCEENNEDVSTDDVVLPCTLNIQYTLTQCLSEEETEKYIQNAKYIGKVTNTTDIDTFPTEKLSSNFLSEGTELYLADNHIIAIDYNVINNPDFPTIAGDEDGYGYEVYAYLLDIAK